MKVFGFFCLLIFFQGSLALADSIQRGEAPKSLTIVSQTCDSAKLTWSAPSDISNLRGYRLIKLVEGQHPEKIELTVPRFTDSFPEGTKVTYKVRAIYYQKVGSQLSQPVTNEPKICNRSCPKGAIDLTNVKLSEGVSGKDWVPIGDLETHTYCYTLTQQQVALQIYIADRTGYDQCSWGKYEIIPPANSGLNSYVTEGRGGGGAITNPPLGTYLIKIKESLTPNCDDKYKIIVL